LLNPGGQDDWLFLASNTSKRRWFVALYLIILFVFVLGTGFISAQTPASRKLNVGDTVTGALNAQAFAKVTPSTERTAMR